MMLMEMLCYIPEKIEFARTPPVSSFGRACCCSATFIVSLKGVVCHNIGLHHQQNRGNTGFYILWNAYTCGTWLSLLYGVGDLAVRSMRVLLLSIGEEKWKSPLQSFAAASALSGVGPRCWPLSEAFRDCSPHCQFLQRSCLVAAPDMPLSHNVMIQLQILISKINNWLFLGLLAAKDTGTCRIWFVCGGLTFMQPLVAEVILSTNEWVNEVFCSVSLEESASALSTFSLVGYCSYRYQYPGRPLQAPFDFCPLTLYLWVRLNILYSLVFKVSINR